jgi:uncharacterized protein YuzE
LPGVNVEFNKKGEIIGIEVLNASKQLADFVTQLEEVRKREKLLYSFKYHVP